VLLVALAGGTAVTVLVWGLARRRLRAALPVVITSCSALVFAIAFTWATNPIARINTVQWLADAGDVARSFPWEGTIRTAGKDLQSTDLPWWYVPAWLAAQLPLLTLAAVAGGLAVLVVGFIRRWEVVDARTTIPLVPIALQAVALPVGIVLGGAVLYDGIRHVLFIVPALIAMAAAALAVLDRGMSRLRVALPVGAVLVVAVSLSASIRWAPYSYAFVNPIAGRNKDGRSWELDFWGVSAREGVNRLEELGATSIHVAPSAGVGIPYGAVGRPIVPGSDTGLYVFLRYSRAADFGCTVSFTIERDGHVLGEGGRCPAVSQG
jgi:hypothetical protein